MPQKTSQKFKSTFLLEFTKQLILASGPTEIIQLESQIKENEKEIQQEQKQIKKQQEKFREQIKEKIKHPEKITQPILPPRKITFKPIQRTNVYSQKQIQQVLRIPSAKLPPRLQYLQPRPTKKQIDLGKLNPLIQDPNVQIIECNGPDKPIIVKIPSPKTSKVTLNKKEIQEIIEKFSQSSKIPVSKGIYRVAFGRLVFSAIVSEIVGSKFIIRKMPAPKTRII